MSMTLQEMSRLKTVEDRLLALPPNVSGEFDRVVKALAKLSSEIGTLRDENVDLRRRFSLLAEAEIIDDRDPLKVPPFPKAARSIGLRPPGESP